MKKLALILATAAAFGLTSAAFAQGPAASTRQQVQPAQTQSHVTHKLKTSHRRGVRNVVVVRHDRGLHRGFVHSRHYGSDNVKKVVVRHTPNKADKRAVSKACSDQANEMNLHGKVRKKFRSECKRSGGKAM